MQFSVPFVLASGGHSTWSTIGKEDFVVDLSINSGVELDENHVAKIKGGTLTKELQVTLNKKGRFTSK